MATQTVTITSDAATTTTIDTVVQNAAAPLPRRTKRQRLASFAKSAAIAGLWMGVGSVATVIGLANLGED